MDTNTITLTLKFKDDGTISIVDQAKGKVAEFDKTVDSMSKGSLAQMRDGWIAITAKIGLATAAFYAAKRMIYDTALQIASATNDIERQANVLGINTDEFQKWQYAAKMSDVNAQELAIALKMLSRSMEGASSGAGESSKYFSAMGISVKDTHGNLRPLNEVMGDVMDKFASWEDGPRKIAIAMQLFGRSGETLIPLLNKGKTGFNELAAEAQKLGVILSPELIRKGSEAEDAFKKLNSQIETFKLSLAPAAKAAAGFFEDVVQMAKDAANKIKSSGFGIDVAGAAGFGEAMYFKSTEELLKYSQQQADLLKKKTSPPTDGRERENILLIYKDPLEAYREQAQKYADITEQIVKKRDEEIKAAEEEYIQSSIANYQRWADEQNEIQREYIESSIAQYQRFGGEQVEIGKQTYDQRLADEQEYINSSIANYQRWGEEQVRIAEESYKKAEEQMKKFDATVSAIGFSIFSIWSSNFSEMLRGTISFAEGVKNIWLDIADYAIQQMMRMAANYALFGSMTGEKGGTSFFGTSGGWGGIIGGILSLFGLQQGGSFWVNRPTPLLVGEGGQREFVSVIPENQMKRQSEQKPTVINNYYTYVQATDLDSFKRLYQGKILEVVSDDARGAGVMRGIIKGIR